MIRWLLDDDDDIVMFYELWCSKFFVAMDFAGFVVLHFIKVTVVRRVVPWASLCCSTPSPTAEGELQVHLLHFLMSLDFILKSTGVT